MLPLESVPNVSEGRDAAVIGAIGDAFAAHATLLDVHSDPDHNRSVFTLVGADQGKTLEGAAIGAAAGGSLGGLLGNQVDRAEAQDQAVRQANYDVAMNRAVSPQDVVQMVASGLSDTVITEHVRSYGVTQSLNVNDLVYLKQQGVSDAVINTMQQARTPNMAAYPPGPAGSTTKGPSP